MLNIGDVVDVGDNVKRFRWMSDVMDWLMTIGFGCLDLLTLNWPLLH